MIQQATIQALLSEWESSPHYDPSRTLKIFTEVYGWDEDGPRPLRSDESVVELVERLPDGRCARAAMVVTDEFMADTPNVFAIVVRELTIELQSFISA